jgi:hypothetical protein
MVVLDGGVKTLRTVIVQQDPQREDLLVGRAEALQQVEPSGRNASEPPAYRR